MDHEATKSEHAKIIPALPTLEIVLKVTEIPPLDIFYSPLHKAVVRRPRKRIRVVAPKFSPGYEPMDVVRKDMPFNLANLIRLSQFTGAYASATMDKAIEVSTLLKEREERITQLEQELKIEKASANKQAAKQLAQL